MSALRPGTMDSGGHHLSAMVSQMIDGIQSDPQQALGALVRGLSDTVPSTQLLDRVQRRQLVRSVRERLGPDHFAQLMKQATLELRLHPGKSLGSLLCDVGPSADQGVVRALMERFGMSESNPPKEENIALLLADVLSATAESTRSEHVIDVESLVGAVAALNAYLAWTRVIKHLDDSDSLKFPLDARWDTLASVLRVAPKDREWAAVSALWVPWSHTMRQLQILDGLTSLDTQVFSFALLPGRKVLTMTDVDGASQQIQSVVASLENAMWNVLELIEVLIRIASWEDPSIRGAVTMLMDKAIKANAELVFVALHKIPQPWSMIHQQLISKLFSMFLAGHTNHQLAFHYLLRLDTSLLLDQMRSVYNDNAMMVSRIGEVAQELNILDALLDDSPFFFAMDLACVASRKDAINLENWLQEKVERNGSTFIRSALEFVDAKVKDDLSKQDPQAEQTTVPLTVHAVATFLRVLRSNGDEMSSEEIDYFKAVRNLCLQLHPRLMNLAPGNEGQEPGLQVVTFSQDVHKKVDGYYRQMYEEKISNDDLIDLLRKFKASNDEQDRQIFACMVHTLFDEYRCFEMYYPPRELAMTAVVFGSLIQHQLIDFIPLGIAIRYVLDALRSSPESNMFKFGLQALLRFQDRLPEWPQLGQALLSLPAAQQSHPDIARIIRAIANGEMISSSQNDVLVPGRTTNPPFTSINVDMIRNGTQAEEPDEQTSDKILFIVNNLSPSNLQEKLTEARRLIKPELHRWLSSYLVLQRVSIEPNNHALYTDFIDGLDAQTLLQHIFNETLAKVKLLLNSDKTVQSTTERTILKNLGSWLGNLTLARDKPIRHRNLAFKNLLVEGYDSNRLIVAIPFICKVLEQCARSKIFKPPNPWLMAVLHLLVELYQFAELKLNLKFEIEVLFKSLDIDLKQIQSTTILRNRPQELAAQEAQRELAKQQRELHAQQISPGHANQQQAMQQHQHAIQSQHDTQQQQQLLLQQMRNTGGPTPGLLSQDADRQGANRHPDALNATLAQMLQTLPAYVQFNQGVAHFANNSALERMIYAAIERAIREIIHPVVERSVTIAAISTRELITKDFAMESDESKMRKAAHQMAQNLAGSLALVTCKEPLRISMVTHARTLFLQNGFTEQNVPEQAIMVIMQDNLDLACSVVERAAMQKSLQEVDDGLTNAYIARGEHRMRGRGFYWDANALAQSQYASTLPDLLKLKPDGLQAQQLRVYEEFGQMPRAVGDVADRASASPSMAHMQDTMLSYGGGVAVDSEARQRELLHQMHLAQQQSSQQQAQAIDSSAFPQDAALLSPQQSLERFTQCINNLENVLQQSNERDSSNANDIRSLAQQIALLSLQSANRDETSLVFAQKVVQLLYKSESDLARDVYIHLLEQLCEISVKAAKEVTAWLLYAEDERKFNVAVTVGLIRAGLVNISEQDAQLSTFMQSREFKASIVDFSAKLAYACLKKPACATRQQLSGIIDTLVRAQQQGKATALADEFLHELQGGNLPVKTDVENSQPLREQLAFCFAEWIRLYQHSPNPDKSFIEFVTQLQGQGILKGEEISSMFFRVCAEVGVDSYIKHKAVGGNHITGIFQPIDAFSKLVVLLIKYHADPSGAKNEQAKVHYLTKILSIVVLVLAQSHEELGAHFQQKPFFRFFSSLLHDLHQAEASLQATYRQTLLAISTTLNTLQPSFFPGFTFSWMSLISHRLFMPKLLASTPANVEGNTDQDEGHVAFNRLFTSLLRFIAPIIRPYQLQDTSRVLYRGTMRIALVLLHDHPDFLATYADGLVSLVPPQCVQLRNLILSSYRREEFPSGLPDVMGINIAAPTSEILTAKEAVNYPDYDVALNAVADGSLRSELDGFLRGSHSTESNATSILTKLSIDNKPASMALLSAVVLHVGITSLAQTGNGNGWQENGVRILQIFLQQSDPERRYLLANSICDQLRYPNRRTAFYSSTLLRIYSEVKETREALLRVLLERTIVNRPHPWGLLATLFTLLSDDQRYPSPANTPEEIMKLLDHIRIGLGSGNTASTLKVNGNGSTSPPGRFPYPQRHEIPT